MSHPPATQFTLSGSSKTDLTLFLFSIAISAFVVYIHSYNRPSFHLGVMEILITFQKIISWYLFTFVKLHHSNILV